MDKTSDIETKACNTAIRGHVRMAYTYNGEQPVLCTLLSEQPYFYIEEEIIEDEDSLFDYGIGEDIEMLERDIAAMKRKMDVYDRLSGEFKRDEDVLMQEFITDSSIICRKNSVSSNICQQTFENMLETLKKSRTACELIDLGDKYGLKINASRDVKDASYIKSTAQLLVNPDMAVADQILCMTRELRRHWQHRQGVLLHPLSFQPDEAIVVNRAQQADLAAFMIRIGWDLYLAGEKDVWQRIETSQLADLGRAFAREAYSDFRTLNSGAAAGAVFETWFLSERCRYADKELIQAMLADYQGLVFEESQMSRSLSMDLISRLGEQPFGKNYLAPYAQMVLSDPIFTDVRDRANANFLWFIKFERSFRETEHDLHSSEDIHSPIFTEGLISDTVEDIENEQSFADASPFGSAGKTGRASGPLENNNTGSNIIYVQFDGLQRDRADNAQS